MSLSENRRKETASVYSLLFAMTGNRNLVIGHKPSGKPYVDGYKIGISHTKGFVSVILSTSCDVAVDIEYINIRVLRIADRFLREDEKPATLLFSMKKDKSGDKDIIPDVIPDIIPTLLFWCAKETIYKLYSDERLTFQNIKIMDAEQGGALCGNNLITGESVRIDYTFNNDYVLTYARE